MDDQRDYAEEAANRREMQEEGEAELADQAARAAAERTVVETIGSDRLITDSVVRAEFDVEAIIDDLRKLTGDYDFDEITTDRFMEIVAKHDNSARDERSAAEKSDPNFKPYGT